MSIPLCRVYAFDRCLSLVFTITETYRMVLQLKKNPLCFLSVQSCLSLEPLATTDWFNSLIVLSFPECLVIGIMQHVAFSDWLLLLSNTRI